MIRNILAALVLLIYINSFARNPKRVSETRYDWSELAQSITQGKTTKYDKAYAIYRWLCDNIAYDTSSSIHNADEAYEQKRGVCQAYCDMFYRLGEAVGLDVEIISGKSKDRHGMILDDGHAWVFVLTDGKTGILIDPTWGAGGVDNGQFTHSEKDDTWFHVDPAWMIFTHYPDSESYQFLDENIDYSSFISLPPLYPSLKKFGFKADELLSSSLAGNIPDIPKCFDICKLKLAKIPQEGTLRVGATYDFLLEPEDDYEFIIINGDEHDKEWERNDSYHLKKYVPSMAERLVVGYRNRGSKDDWTHLISYKVADPTPDDISNLENIAPHKSSAFKELKNFDINRLSNRGVDMGKLLEIVRRDDIKQLPVIYDAGDFKLSDVPLNGKLKVGVPYRFAFLPNEEGDWAIIDNGNFLTEWEHDPQTGDWVTTIIPSAPGELVFAFKSCSATANKYSYCMEYEVED